MQYFAGVHNLTGRMRLHFGDRGGRQNTVEIQSLTLDTAGHQEGSEHRLGSCGPQGTGSAKGKRKGIFLKILVWPVCKTWMF